MTTIKHLISINDLNNDDLYYLVDRSVYFFRAEGNIKKTLDDKVIGIYFKKTSTRTRTGFSSGAIRLGAQIVQYGPNDLQLNTGETMADTKVILSQMLHGIVARTAENQSELECLSDQANMSVINAMSKEEHPTQAITDLAAIKSHFGRIEGIKVLYVGEGNNTAVALALALTRYKDAEVYFQTPGGFGLDEATIQKARENAEKYGSVFNESHVMDDLPGGVDVVYTTRWQTTGTSKSDPDWRDKFMPFQVNDELMKVYRDGVFMHDLPAHRGDEVLGSVLDGERSIAFEQSKYKLYSAMAVLEWCVAGKQSS